MIDLIQGDCLDRMKGISDKSIELVLTDPPYNIGKAKWDKIPNYIEWCGKWIIECQRVLKDNGSFYFWHNDMVQIAQLMEWIRKNTRLVFKQMIVWNKRFDKASNKGFLDGFVVVEGLRNYQQMCEYCLFYTFQDDTGLTTVMLDTNNFPTMRGYFKDLQEYIGLNKKQILERIGQNADHCFRWNSSQWDMPTAETYQQLIDIFNIREWDGFREYESLRQEYESLRYTFNNQKTHHSVWDYEIAERQAHITPKPVNMMENIILHSSNEGDTVLDCFMGSGSTGVACVKTGRNFIGIELDPDYHKAASERLERAKAQVSMLDIAPEAVKQLGI